MAGTSNSAQSLQARLEKVQSSLKAQEAKLQASRRMTMIVGVIALVLAGGYFIYGYQQFASVLRAQTLVGIAQDLVNNNLPVARKALAEQINDSADVWAQGLSQQALGALPDASAKLEDYVVGQVDEALSQAALVQDDQFREFVKSKHDVLQQGFDDLAQGPQIGEDALQAIGTALEEKFDRDLAAQATDLFGAVINLNAKLEHLRDGKHLTPDEVVERRVLMLANRIKMNEHEATANATPNNSDSAGLGADLK